MPTRSLNVAITGDARSLNRVLDDTESRTKRWGGNVAKGFAVAGAAAAGGLTVGLKKAADAAVQAEKTQARLEAQLRASGISYRKHADEIDKVIQKHSRLSGLDDEDLTDAFTNIVRVTGEVDKSLRLTGLAADFARAKHMDVAKAGEVVAKVAGGNTGILSRYGFQIDKGATASEALGKMQEKFAGQAERYGKTTAGAMDRASVASENLGEAVGAKLTPWLAKAADAMLDVLEWTERTWPKVKKVIGGAVDAVVGFVRRFRARNREDIEAVVEAVQRVGRFFKRVFEDVIVPAVKAALPPIKTAIEGILRVIRGLVRVVSGIINGDWSRAWDGVKDIVGGALKAARGVIRASFELFTSVMSTLGKKIASGIITGLGNLGHLILDRVKDAVGWVKDHLGDIGKSIGKVIAGGIGVPIGDAGPRIAGSIPGGAFGGGGGNTAGLQIEARQGLSFLRSTFGGVTLSSGRRSVAENRRVGGASNSDHLTGLATDLVPAEGWTFSGINRLDRIAAWARKSPLIRWIGWRGTPGHGPGDHLHLSWVDRVAGDVTAQTAGAIRGGGLGRFDSTSYGPPWGGINGGGVTATGVNLKGSPHTYGVAVDPDVIPLGSRLKISPNPFGYGGFFTAFDTGGAIQGNRIDFYDWRGRASQMRWGTRSVTVSTDSGGSGGGGGARSGSGAAARSRFAAAQARARQRSAAATARARGNQSYTPRGPLNSFIGRGFSPNAAVPLWEQEIAGAGEAVSDPAADALAAAIAEQTRATEEHTAALKAVQGEMERNRKLGESAMASDDYQLKKYLADFFSGRLALMASNRGLTPGVASEVTY